MSDFLVDVDYSDKTEEVHVSIIRYDVYLNSPFSQCVVASMCTFF
jgi:hypothetical protein